MQFSQNVYGYQPCLLKKVTRAVGSSLLCSRYTSGWTRPWAPPLKKILDPSIMMAYACAVCNCGSSGRTLVQWCILGVLLDWHLFWLHVLPVTQGVITFLQNIDDFFS